MIAREESQRNLDIPVKCLDCPRIKAGLDHIAAHDEEMDVALSTSTDPEAEAELLRMVEGHHRI